MNKLQELSICISSTEKNVEITMSKENFDKVNYDLKRKEKLEKVWNLIENNIVIEEANVLSTNTPNIIHIPCNDIYVYKDNYNLLKEMLEEK